MLCLSQNCTLEMEGTSLGCVTWKHFFEGAHCTLYVVDSWGTGRGKSKSKLTDALNFLFERDLKLDCAFATVGRIYKTDTCTS